MAGTLDGKVALDMCASSGIGEADTDYLRRMIGVNVMGLMYVTHGALP